MPGEVATGRFITRDARREDHPAFARFWAELGIDQPAPDIEYWDIHLRPKTIFLEAPGGELAAYALTFPFGARGDVRQIVVDPSFRRRGVGQQLLAEVAARFRAARVRD